MFRRLDGLDNFQEFGPKNFTASNINWENKVHRRVVAACLVQAVVVLRKELRIDPKKAISNAAAQEWWKTLGFSLVNIIKDSADCSVFGAVFASASRAPPRSPALVVAFRGSKNLQDLVFDINLILHRLHRTSRFTIAIQTVEDVASRAAGNARVWLAGHSLGAALAMAAGRRMAMKGVRLESFLFNPPYPAAPVEMLDGEWKAALRRLSDFAKAVVLELVAEDRRGTSQRECMDSFRALSEWVPNLFVNVNDFMCVEYKGYFERMGRGNARRSMFSLSDLLLKGMKEESQAIHLIPSAVLSLSTSSAHTKLFDRAIAAHRLQQWWNLDLELLSETTYKFT